MEALTEVTARTRMTRARLFVGIEQEEMARLLGKSRNTISAWERGVSEPPLSAVARWAEITGRSIDWFVWGDDAERPPAEAEGLARPKGLEPLTFCSVADLDHELAFWALIYGQEALDANR